MISISLYQSGGFHKTVPFPEEWNECSTADIEVFSRAVLSSQDSIAIRTGIFMDMLRLRVPEVKDLVNDVNLEDVARHSLDYLDFFFASNMLTRQPYLKLKLRSCLPISVAGPADAFNSLTCGEFEEAEQYAFQFNEVPEQEPLARLAAVLYRPKGLSYFTRNKAGNIVPYDAEKLLPFFMKLPAWKLFTIYTWYTGCKTELPELFPDVFSGGDGGGGTDDPMVFTKCIHAGAGEKNGSREKIRMTLLKEYFYEMQLEAEKTKELKRKMKQPV